MKANRKPLGYSGSAGFSPLSWFRLSSWGPFSRVSSSASPFPHSVFLRTERQM